MAELYNAAAPKKAANLSINSDLLRKTRKLNINLSATLERALREELSKREAAQWVEENRTAIKSYNDFVEQHGCFSDEFKRSAFGGESMQGLTPEISFADQELLLLTPQISPVPEKHLKKPVGARQLWIQTPGRP